MKKLFSLFLMMIIASAFIFADVIIESSSDYETEEQDDDSNSGFIISMADTYCLLSNRLNTFKPNSGYFGTNGFDIQLGSFKSDEDGLIDIISDSLFGFRSGKASTQGNYNWNYYGNTFYANSDGDFWSIYSKNDVGIQLNLFVISIAGTIGVRGGYDMMHQTGYSSSNVKKMKINESTFFVDFVTGSYVSLNLGKSLKLLFDFDIGGLPLLTVKFDTVETDGIKRTTKPVFEWFGTMDNDLNVAVSAIFFF